MPEIASDFSRGESSMCHLLLQPGRAYSFHYPRHNYRLLPTTTELRRIVVHAIRDMTREPLDGTTPALNPLVLRGRWLVTGIDLDKDVERSFYHESMKDIQALSQDDLQPLKDVEYVLIEQMHVAFKAQCLKDVLNFRSTRETGTICAVLCHAPRKILFDSDPELEDERSVT